MSFTVFIIPIVLPVLFWAGYHYYKDRHLPEPPGNLLAAFVLGIASYYLGLAMYHALDLAGFRYDAYELAETNLTGLFLYALLAIGTIEEAVKLIPFLAIVIRFRAFNEPIDGIIYSSFIALGFAAAENIQYLQFLTGPEALARGFVSPVVHIVFASIWGYYIGRVWLCRRSVTATVFVALAITAMLHGLYDFVVIALPAPALPVAALLIVGIWVWRLRLIRDLHALPAGPCPEEDDTPVTGTAQ
jgi:RsiW-degrading membrane proteinase PrsW (M82 family)